MKQPRTYSQRAKIAAVAAVFAAPMEGLRQYAYYDPPGILTVCYGHTGPDVVKGVLYPVEKCKSLLSQDMLGAVATVDNCVPGLPDKVLVAFADAVFNSGPKIACNRTASTAARLLYSGKIKDACNELPRWNKANVGGVMIPLPGLTKRTLLRRDICLEAFDG